MGGKYLWRERGQWMWIALGLCLYFTLADAVAIRADIWHFDTTSLIGLWIGPVPIEEVLFYLLTAIMLVQGFVLTWYGNKSESTPATHIYTSCCFIFAYPQGEPITATTLAYVFVWRSVVNALFCKSMAYKEPSE